MQELNSRMKHNENRNKELFLLKMIQEYKICSFSHLLHAFIYIPNQITTFLISLIEWNYLNYLVTFNIPCFFAFLQFLPSLATFWNIFFLWPPKELKYNELGLYMTFTWIYKWAFNLEKKIPMRGN